jgi:small-conductance mechanosensitive channel
LLLVGLRGFEDYYPAEITGRRAAVSLNGTVFAQIVIARLAAAKPSLGRECRSFECRGQRWRHRSESPVVVLATCLLWFPAGAALAQWLPGSFAAAGATSNPPAAVGRASLSPQSLEERLAEARAQSAAAEAFGESTLTGAPAGVSPQELLMQQVLRRRLVRLLEQQLSDVAELEAARTRRAALIEEAQGWTRFPEPPPYSIFLTDHLREEIEVERLRIRNAESILNLLAEMLERNRRLFAQSEEKIRRLNEQLELDADSDAAARWSWLREQERLRSQVVAASLGVFEAERRLREERMAESRVRLNLLLRQSVIAQAGMTFNSADLEQAIAVLGNERAALEEELATMEGRWTNALAALESTRAKARALSEPGTGDPAGTAPALQQVATQETQLEALGVAVRALRLMLEVTTLEQTMWQLRFAVGDTRKASQLRDSARQLADLSRRLELWREHELQQLNESASRIQLQESQLNQLAPNSALRLLVQEELEALRGRDQYLLRALRGIERAERLSQRWAEGLRTAEARLPLVSRIASLFSDGRSFLQRVWSFELFAAADTITVDGQQITGKRSVTIGKVSTAVLILVVGYWVSGLLARMTESQLVRQLKVEVNLARLISRWTRTVLVICLIVISLASVRIPLTAFAFAGGALAIGLGFGMQNILKNFVSGLILLFERPFRVGDVLDVGGQQGEVTGIGLRASVLRLWDGKETLIPNSSLLEGNVTNWTYSDNKVRLTVCVGVAYGSDVRRVAQSLEGVAQRHGLVEKDPKPMVLFTDFADSSLDFELRCWVDFSKASPVQVESDLRSMIHSVFAENGIVIAFPQRDLHLHAPRPIAVEMAPPPPPPIHPFSPPPGTESAEPRSAGPGSAQGGKPKVTS